MTIELAALHEVELSLRCGWSTSADLGHGPPVEVLGVRVVGEDGFEVLTHRGWRRAVSCHTEQRVKVVAVNEQVSLFG